MIVLLVDDSEPIRFTLGTLLEEAGHAVHTAASLAQARGVLAARAWDVVLLDVNLDDGMGMDLIPAVRALQPSPLVVMLTGGYDEVPAADLVVRKGGHPDDIVKAIEAAAAARAS
jgi:DNA-binding response OmpR family regulator